MKKKYELNGSVMQVTLKADNDETFEFSYKLDSVHFLSLYEVYARLEKSEKKGSKKTQEQQGQEMVKLFSAVKRVIGLDTYEEILDFSEENGEDFSIQDLISLVTPNNDEFLEDLPKE